MGKGGRGGGQVNNLAYTNMYMYARFVVQVHVNSFNSLHQQMCTYDHTSHSPLR